MPHKGQKYLIDATARVLRDEPDTRVVIAGEGELQAALAQQIRHHHLEKHVILAGFRPDILSLHKAFDVFVMSSVTEGLGTSLLDAMACARPVVATRVGGIPEVVVDGETGFLGRHATLRRSPRQSSGCSRTAACARRWARPASTACSRHSVPSTWCARRSACIRAFRTAKSQAPNPKRQRTPNVQIPN